MCTYQRLPADIEVGRQPGFAVNVDWIAVYTDVPAHALPDCEPLGVLNAADLPVAADVQPEVDAIEQDRRLLDEPDSVPGLVDKLAQALREALNQAHATCKKLQQEGQALLDASATWQQLSLDQQTTLTEDYQLNTLPTIAVGTTDEILATLTTTRLKEWKTLADALPTRFAKALAAAAKLLEPKAQHVKLTGGTIKNEDDLRNWLTTTETQIRDKLKDGPVIL